MHNTFRIFKLASDLREYVGRFLLSCFHPASRAEKEVWKGYHFMLFVFSYQNTDCTKDLYWFIYIYWLLSCWFFYREDVTRRREDMNFIFKW